MRTVAVYPGRFHVFHRGHQAVYDHLIKQYGPENVYIATSEKYDDKDSPFRYEDKVQMMTRMGVPASRIIKIVNPYKIDEITKRLGLDQEQDRLVYALGAKDAQRFEYKPESALQLLSQTRKMAPVGKHAYVQEVPTATFNVQGQPVTSASQIRKMYQDGNDNDRNQIIADLYGEPDPELRAVFDQRLGINTPQEGIIYGQEKIFAGDKPQSIMREERMKVLKENIHWLRHQLAQAREGQDYLPEKRTKKSSST